VRYVQKYATPAGKNARNTKWIIAKNARKLADVVRTPAARWPEQHAAPRIVRYGAKHCRTPNLKFLDTTMKTYVTRRSFLSLCTAALVFASTGFAAGPAPEKDQRRFEIRFLEMMIDHHYGAVKMSELCPGRTVHPELLAMCEMIKTAQLAEIQQMQTWLQTWYGVTHEPMLDRKSEKQIEYLATLTGAAFEKAYMSIMIEHHSMAAMMAVDCLNEAYHPEMLNMCAMMLATQGDEIAQMRIWLQQWYGINDLDRNDHS